MKFKKEFFKHIQNIDDYFKKTEIAKTFDELDIVAKEHDYEASLKFISKYAHVSFDSMQNYARIYPLSAHLEDKKGWLKWYEENRCNNIQFK